MEKRLTRRSAGESLNKFRTSRDTPLNIIKEEPAADSIASNASSSNTSSKSSKSASKNEPPKRRSEPPGIIAPEPVAEPSSDTSAVENQEKRSSRRIKDQKSATSLVSSKNVTNKIEQTTEAVVSSTPTIKFDLGPTEPSPAEPKTETTDASIAGNLKMITRRRSSNLLRSGTTNSSTFLSQSLNLGKSRSWFLFDFEW